MAILLITYSWQQETATPTENYQRLYDAISQKSTSWWHYIPNVWLIDTAETSDQWYERLLPFLNTHPTGGDMLFITEIIPQSSRGWLPKDAGEWLTRRMAPPR